MKKLIVLLLAVSIPALAQSNGVYNATNYAYTSQVTAGNSTTGTGTILAQPTAFVQGIPFLPYNLNASITINRNAANAETVTPTTLANCYPNSLTCAITANFNNKHIGGESIQSGTFGLQEALNVAVVAGSGTVLIDASWGGPAGSSVITAAKGATTVMIQDNRNPSGAVFYQWNGSAYAQAGGGSTVTSVFGRTGPITAQTGDYTCAQITNCNSATGIQSINSDTTPAQSFAASGTGLTVSHTAGVTTYTLTGGAGTGAVSSGLVGQIGGYQANGTTIAQAPGLYSVNPAWTVSQINSWLAALPAGSTVLVPQGTAGNFTANFNVKMIAQQAGADLFPALGNGIACDTRTVFNISFTSGSQTVTSTGGFVASDVGRTILAAGPIGGTQYVFTPTITAFGSSSSVTISTASPFTLANFQDPVGTMSTTALQAIMNQAGTSYPIILPAGCQIMSDTLSWNGGQNIQGQASGNTATSIVFVDGHDGFQQPDAAGLGGAGAIGSGLQNINIQMGGRVDAAAAPITYVSSAGTVTVQQPLYRPDHYLMSDNANPFGSAWCQGTCQNGVASTTASSTIICVPTSYFSRLTAAGGNKIMFRDFPAMYVGTVVNLAAGGCAGGFSGATINPALPAGGAYTNAQIEWMQSTSGFQQITTTIPVGTVTYPFTVSFASSIAPTPARIDNFPTHGRLKTANGEEYVWIGANYLNNTAVIRSGPTSSAGQTGPIYVAPMNPCPAKYETPWPVQPTVNANDSTPSGANYFPSRCIGNAAISFPEVNGNVYSQGGLSKGFIKNINVSVNDPYHAFTLDFNSTACMYFAGNTAPYNTEIGFLSCIGPQYGFYISPASYGMAGVQAHAVFSVNNHFHDWTLRTAYGISIVSSDLFHIEDVDAYSTAFNPYDGTQMGAGESLFLGYTLNEQDGSLVTNTAGCNVTNWNAEPEGGNGNEVPTYFESQCANAWFQGNTFEGVPAVFGGQNQTVKGGQLSSLAAAPILNYGSGNVIEDTQKTSQGAVTTTYGICTYCDWGTFNRAKVPSANGTGPIISPGVGNRNSYDGDDSTYAIIGNYSLPSPTNILSGFISNDELSTAGLPKTIDPTAPKGSYTTCTVTPGSSCTASSFNGFNGGILIGPYDRLQPIKQEFTVWMKAATGTPAFLLYISALNPAAGTCSTPGTIVNPLVTISSSWAAYAIPVDLTNYSGCGIGFSFGPSTGATVAVRISSPDLMPVPGLVHVPTTAYTAGAACPTWAVAGDLLSFDGTKLNLCYAGVVVQK